MHQIALPSRVDLASEKTYFIGVLLGFIVTAVEAVIALVAIDGFISGKYVLV